ncbi:ATP-binding protein, partial [Candidatus Synechococcus spongiarum]|uniref:ATP-binding protein n=1 Tax=Candidatus Synechococcus spongiarum TaxID=431041 RepID=UPI00054EFD00
MTHCPHSWQAYNLRGSPYFQDSLSRNARNTPLSLFVGRQRELQKLLIRIEGSLTGSRQAVAGRPGIGKTTLVEVVKAEARDARLKSSPNQQDHFSLHILSPRAEATLDNPFQPLSEVAFGHLHVDRLNSDSETGFGQDVTT